MRLRSNRQGQSRAPLLTSSIYAYAKIEDYPLEVRVDYSLYPDFAPQTVYLQRVSTEGLPPMQRIAPYYYAAGGEVFGGNMTMFVNPEAGQWCLNLSSPVQEPLSYDFGGRTYPDNGWRDGGTPEAWTAVNGEAGQMASTVPDYHNRLEVMFYDMINDFPVALLCREIVGVDRLRLNDLNGVEVPCVMSIGSGGGNASRWIATLGVYVSGETELLLWVSDGHGADVTSTQGTPLLPQIMYKNNINQ